MSLALFAQSAHACVPALPEPRLEGESDEAYRVRSDALERSRAEGWLTERQARGLRAAELIFIGRDTNWSPPSKHYTPIWKNGRVMPPIVTVPAFKYPGPTYFKPIAWFRGPKVTDLFQLTADMTSCGPMGLGDTTYSTTGDLFVFFAHKRPLSADTIIDAIAVGSITDPALLDFVAKYRKAKPKRPQAG